MKYAFRDTHCEDCGDLIIEGDPIYFNDDGKLCSVCARRDFLVCPNCQSQKKAQYNTCFTCGGRSSGEQRQSSFPERVNAGKVAAKPVRRVRIKP